jgi:hypothetical protein
MAYQYDDPIGTGQTYTTPGAWETARKDRKWMALFIRYNQA